MTRLSPEQLAANRVGTLERQRTNPPPPHVARWNEYAFDCPACGRHYDICTTKILKVDGHWHCQPCVLKMTNTSVSRIQGIRIGKEQLGNIEQLECATCHQPFKNRRVVLNARGHLVHYRCPKKSGKPPR